MSDNKPDPRGVIVRLTSGSFPGVSCFIFRDRRGRWSRITAREEAEVFATEADARAQVEELLAEIRYQAPELNRNLGDRLHKAEYITLLPEPDGAPF